MGSDTTGKAISCQFYDRFGPIGKQQLAMLAAGQDPKDLALDSVKRVAKRGSRGTSTSSHPHTQHLFILFKHSRTYINSNPEISKFFGTDSTGGGIGFQFRAIKANAELQKNCIASGGDPKDLGIGAGKSQKLSPYVLSTNQHTSCDHVLTLHSNRSSFK